MELINYPWREVLTGVAIVLALMMAIVLVVNKYPSTKWLGIQCLIYAVVVFFHETIGLSFSLPLMSFMTIVLYLYAKSFFRQNNRISWLHLLTVSLVVLNIIVVNSEIVTRLICGTISILYFLLTIKYLNAEGAAKGINWWLNPGGRVQWLRNFIVCNILLGLIFFSYPSLNSWTLAIMVLIVIGFIIFQIIRESSFITPATSANKYQKSTLSPAIKSAILSKLDELFEKEKFHLRDDASLANLAEALGATTHHVSQVLNESKQISFQELITQYRIRAAKELLKDPTQQQLKIESIATMVGYNSKSAFNTAFKRYTGQTPSEFKTSKSVLTYREERLPGRKETDSGILAVSLNHSFSLKTKTAMVLNFFKTFTRNLKRNKLFSLINLFGLTLAFLCSVFIYLFIADEMSYDKQTPDHERIYRINWINQNPQTRTPHPMAQAFVYDWPEVEQAVSISPWFDAGLNREKVLVENVVRDVKFEEQGFFFADSTFFEVFGVEVIEGDPDALSKPWSLVITDEMAQKYFGNESAVGKELRISDMPSIVSTVVKALPENNHFHFQALIPYMTLKTINPENVWMTWDDFGHFNYIKLKPGADAELLESRIPEWFVKQMDLPQEYVDGLLAREVYFELQPITDIHLKSHLRWELETNGNILYVHILTGTLIFLLVIAGINYVNLTTAKSLERAKEIGVRKTLGAVSNTLSIQFYLESVIFCLIAGVVAVLLSFLGLGLFNELSGRNLQLSDLINARFFLISVLVILGIGILSGAYPAFVLSSYKPAQVLKGKLTTSSKGIAVRSVLVTVQFTISAILIAGSLIIVNQIGFMKTKSLGFNKDAVIYMPIPTSVEVGGIDLNKMRRGIDRFNALSSVKSISTTSNIPGHQFNQHPIYVANSPEDRVNASEMFQGYGLQDVLSLELANGRVFDKSYSADSAGLNFMVNEAAVQALNLENPIDQKIVWVDNEREVTGTVVGVIKDFHYRSLHETIQPLIIQLQQSEVRHFVLKLNGEEFAGALEHIGEIYAELYPKNPFAYHFLDEEMGKLYDQEQRTLSIFTIFGGIALILACLGLLGMAYAMLHQRVKEIGLRKILGASSLQIAILVLGQFVRVLLIASLIGLPVAYFMMENWLMEFSYRAPFSLVPFFLALLVLLIIAILSVSSAIAKMVYSKPIDSLRYE